MKGLNLLEKLDKERLKYNEEKVLNDVKNYLDSLIEEDNKIEDSILSDSNDENTYNTLDFDKLESSRIYHISQIEKICVDYRLRFLDSNLFKGDIPQEAITEIKKLNKSHDTELKGFKIIAPSKLFKLENADDPILLAPIGNGYYYFIHKWGNDLNAFRKFLVWPVKTLENFIAVMFVISLAATAIVPKGIFFDNSSRLEFMMLFIFMFKWLLGIALYYGFAKGKNFNEAIWQSKYYNA
jgi:hypothetical protein